MFLGRLNSFMSSNSIKSKGRNPGGIEILAQFHVCGTHDPRCILRFGDSDPKWTASVYV